MGPRVLTLAVLSMAVLVASAVAPAGAAGPDRGRQTKRLRPGRLIHGRVLLRPHPLTRRELERLGRDIEDEDEDEHHASRPRRVPHAPMGAPAGDGSGDLPGRGDAPGGRGSPGSGHDGVGLRSSPFAHASAADDFVLWRNTATGSGTQTMGEPSWANDRNGILFTGNKGAALSPDNGVSWSYVDPADLEPGVPDPELDAGFCCDQHVLAVDRGGYSLILWIQQTTADADGNHIRLVIYQGRDELLSQQDYCIRDWQPSDFGFGAAKFDFGYIAATTSNVYISASVNSLAGSFVSGVVWRVPISTLDDASCHITGAHYWTSSTDWGTALAQGDGSTMYWAFHGATNDQLRVYSVPDSSTTATGHTVNIANYQTTNRGTGHCPVPDGTDPCQRLNDRTQRGWRRPGEVAWLWNVAEGGGFNFPHVRIERISTSTFQPIGEHDVYNQSYAWVYGSGEADDAGNVGLTLYRIGGGEYPRARVSIVDDVTPSWTALTMHGIKTSLFGTTRNGYGDFTTTHRYGDCRNTWGGAVSTMQTSASDGGGEQRFAWFGRERDGCPDLAITRLSVGSEDVTAGDPLDIDVTTRNTGSGSMATSRTAYYLSRDALHSAGDTRIGDSVVSALDPGASSALHAGPNASGVGSFYVIACADDLGVADEISDTNNCLAAPTTITVSARAVVRAAAARPVGFVGTLQTPTGAHKLGTRLSFNVNLRGLGGGPGNIQLRLSRQRVPGGGAGSPGGATVVGARTVALPAGHASRVLPKLLVRHALTPSTKLREGHYYLIVCVSPGRRAPARPRTDRCLASRDVVHLHGRARKPRG